MGNFGGFGAHVNVGLCDFGSVFRAASTGFLLRPFLATLVVSTRGLCQLVVNCMSRIFGMLTTWNAVQWWWLTLPLKVWASALSIVNDSVCAITSTNKEEQPHQQLRFLVQRWRQADWAIEKIMR